MKEEFKKIWERALPYQDKRDDEGHARIVTESAIKLCEIEDVNDIVVVPAAILHDIGWSQLSEEERFLIFDPSRTPEKEFEMRIKHQEEGVKLAEKILYEIEYKPNLIKLITEIISQHDTRKGFLSKEDGIMRDADKLWWYSKPGFDADIRRRGYTFEFYYDKVERLIDDPNFFFSESAKKIARHALKDRQEEFMGGKINIT